MESTSFPKKIFLAILAGALYPIAFAPFGFYWLVFISLALLIILWRDSSKKESLVIGLFFGFSMFSVGTSWVFVSLHNFGNMPLIMSTIVVFFFSLAMASYIGLIGFTQSLFCRLRKSTRCILVIPSLWILGEWVRGNIFGGFPWLYIGYSQTDSLLTGLIPIIGVLGVGFVVVVLVSVFLEILYSHGRKRLVLIFGFLSMLICCGLSHMYVFTYPKDKPINIAMIQNNISLDDKWNREKIADIANGYLQASFEIEDADLVIWPEAAIPLFLDELELDIITILKNADSDFIIGVIQREVSDENARYFNSALAIGDKRFIYKKRKLVPFGEYLPIPSFFGWVFNQLKIPMSNFTPGQMNQQRILLAGQQIGVSICYEDAFGNVIKSALPEATILVNISEDAWFGDSLAPHQRLQMARGRAIEFGRPVIRSSNNGLSSIIKEDGTVTVIAEQFKKTIVQGNVQPMEGTTPFLFWGNVPVLVLCFAFIFIGLFQNIMLAILNKY